MNPEEDKKRISDFLADYKILVDKYNVDFANYPVYIPDGQGAFKTVIQNTPVDMTKIAKPSPFMGK